MGIVFGKSRENNVKVLSMRETQSMPVVRINRKFGQSSEGDQQHGRSTSYQTVLPGLPNLISSDEETKSPFPVPPPFTLPPVSQKAEQGSKGVHRRRGGSPKVVAELSTSNSDEYSSCVEDIVGHIQREKTQLIKEILGKRLDELREAQKHLNTGTLSSRESRKFISSRDSYRKIYLKSRKRSKRNSCISESSLSNSFIRDEDTIYPSGDDDSNSDEKAVLINDKPRKRSVTGCKIISRKSTLNSAIRFNSSSDEDLPQFSIRHHINNTRERRIQTRGVSGRARTRAETVKSRKMVSAGRRKSGVRKSGAWLNGKNFRTSSSRPNLFPSSTSQIPTDAECYDASAEGSSSSSDSEEDELNYSRRFKTNPFLRSTSTNIMTRYDILDIEGSKGGQKAAGSSQITATLQHHSTKQSTGQQTVKFTENNEQTVRTLGPSPIKLPLNSTGQHPIKPDLGRILPNYAKSSYEGDSHTEKSTSIHLPSISRIRRDTSSDLQSSLGSESQFRVGKNERGLTVGRKQRWKKQDEYDELDSAVDMFTHLL